MKINVVPKKEKSIKYPFIGIVEASGTIALFTSASCYVILEHGVSNYINGSFHDNIAINKFTPFQGTIELSND